MLTISAREANQQFSKILEAAVGGEEVTITRRGVPVAKLVPLAGNAEEAAELARRKAEALAFLEKGLDLGPTIPWNREEMYLERLEKRERTR